MSSISVLHTQGLIKKKVNEGKDRKPSTHAVKSEGKAKQIFASLINDSRARKSCFPRAVKKFPKQD